MKRDFHNVKFIQLIISFSVLTSIGAFSYFGLYSVLPLPEFRRSEDPSYKTLPGGGGVGTPSPSLFPVFPYPSFLDYWLVVPEGPRLRNI